MPKRRTFRIILDFWIMRGLKAKGKRQKAKGKRQKAKGKRQKAKSKKQDPTFLNASEATLGTSSEAVSRSEYLH